MSKQYENKDGGAAFRNDRKEKPTQPDYNGAINVDGKDYWFSMWEKQGRNGSFYTFAVKPKDTDYRSERPKPQGVAKAATQRDNPADIPF